MEERSGERLTMIFVSAFVIFLVCIMSYSLWRDQKINAFMQTNRAWGIQCDKDSQSAWVIRDGERVDLTINDVPLYCSGYRFEVRDDAGNDTQLDKYTVYQHLSRQQH
ncbi:hypothetical protein [Entomohabitans teleogrylli]|uniref:hypothetical protein n=1 Tax=Entomohabitans teleogrylli TaxID=1384589 RepID=UPI00073D7F57|nr:hypothetical protein [Entomohabitans teleogrylli]